MPDAPQRAVTSIIAIGSKEDRRSSAIDPLQTSSALFNMLKN
jgi:hypothetical protein